MKLTAASVIFRGRVRRTAGFTPAGTTAETKRPLIMTTRNILWQTIWHTKSRCRMLSIRSVTRDGRAVGVPGKRRHAPTNRSSRDFVCPVPPAHKWAAPALLRQAHQHGVAITVPGIAHPELPVYIRRPIGDVDGMATTWESHVPTRALMSRGHLPNIPLICQTPPG